MEQWRKTFVDKNPVLKLVIFNLVIYVVVLFWEVMNGLPMTKNGLEPQLSAQQIYHPVNWLGLHGNFFVFIKKPWTILTFMFVHERFLSMISNMIWLYFFGSVFQILLSGKKLLPLYLYGGVAGGIMYMVVSSFLQNNYYLTTASLSIFAVASAVTALRPNYKIFTFINGGFSLWIFSLVYALLTLFTTGSMAGVAAHLSAALLGYLFIKRLQIGKDWTNWMINLNNYVNNTFDPNKKREFTTKIKNDEMRLNKILDKINKKGIKSLTREERLFLNKQAK